LDAIEAGQVLSNGIHLIDRNQDRKRIPMPCMRLFVKAPNLGNDNVILLPRILGWNRARRR